MASGSFSITHSEEQVGAVRHHLDEVVQGAAFRGSYRSQQFLRHIVEKALDGETDGLKERTIGVELFQRSPTYDTGQDAIVRVTASDVRRRLLEHYGHDGRASDFHIQLPRGSYIPEIEVHRAPTAHPTTDAPLVTTVDVPLRDETESKHASVSPQKRSRLWIGAAIGAVACLALMFVGGEFRDVLSPKATGALPPWSVILERGHGTRIVTSDPNLEELQELTGHSISLSDYANHRFIPDGRVPTAAEQQFFHYFQHADNAAAVDMPLAVSIARLASADLPIQIHSARSLHITDLQNDDNIILIGSPRSNPWVELFQDQLDFRFVFRQELGQEIVENVNPRTHEHARYLPTAGGFATGESFALVALTHNTNRASRILLLAGASGEGTEAAGHMVTDREHLVRLLEYCGISTGGPVPDFELLLQLRTLAGSPSTTDMVACHIMPSHK